MYSLRLSAISGRNPFCCFSNCRCSHLHFQLRHAFWINRTIDTLLYLVNVAKMVVYNCLWHDCCSVTLHVCERLCHATFSNKVNLLSFWKALKKVKWSNSDQNIAFLSLRATPIDNLPFPVELLLARWVKDNLPRKIQSHHNHDDVNVISRLKTGTTEVLPW